jgi:diguanylate cyclase (GGDEF)-like protein
MALHDALTGLPNRQFFYDLLRNQMARSKRAGVARFALLYLDLDGFKQVNDDLGHQAGDVLLVTIATRLRASLREADTAARIGGDEFTALLVDVGDREEAQLIAARVAAALAAPVSLDGRSVIPKASVGIAMGRLDCNEPADLLREADAAMYRTKRSAPPATSARMVTTGE